MSATDLPIPDPRSPLEVKCIADIAKHGWCSFRVFAGAQSEDAADTEPVEPQEVYDASFRYTAGFWRTFRHPELVIVGRWGHSHSYLSAFADLIRDGRRFAAGDSTDEILDGYDVRLGTVTDDHRLALLTWTDWTLGRRPFAALQVILPDRAGHWPDDPDYVGYAQPLLGEKPPD